MKIRIASALAASAVVVGAWSPASAQSDAAQTKSVAGLLAFEAARVRAEAAYDANALDRETGEDLVLVHGNGSQSNKSQYLASIRNDKHDILGITLSDQAGQIFDDTGITTGIMDNHLASMHRVARYLAVYRYTNGHWLLVRWQSTGLSKD